MIFSWGSSRLNHYIGKAQRSSPWHRQVPRRARRAWHGTDRQAAKTTDEAEQQRQTLLCKQNGLPWKTLQRWADLLSQRSRKRLVAGKQQEEEEEDLEPERKSKKILSLFSRFIINGGGCITAPWLNSDRSLQRRRKARARRQYVSGKASGKWLWVIARPRRRRHNNY